MQKFFFLILLSLVACTPATPIALPTASLTSIPTATATDTPTETPTLTPEPTATFTLEPTPTPILSLRPDFESMTDEQLLQAAEEWGKFFADQIDCSSGVQGLPIPASPPKLVEVNRYGDEFTWRTELLGSYKDYLTDKNNLPAGYVNCLYFASSEPGGGFTVWGGGMLWGEEMSTFADQNQFGLPVMGDMDTWVSAEKLLPLLKPGNKYELSLYSTNDLWSSADIVLRRQVVRGLSISAGYVNGGVASRIRSWFKGRLPANYPAVNGQKLIDNFTIPVSATLRLAGSE